jgi:site-specific DNA-cytosine methylase
MRVLVACEFSGIVREAFKNKGHDAWSCDLLPTEIPGQHIQGDVLEILNDGWDMMIAHPPCTHLAVSGAAWFKQKREDGRQQEGIDFFMKFVDIKCPKVAIENPVGIMSRIYRKPDQIIQPYEYGEPFSKKTCLWLKGLPKLTPTNVVEKGEQIKYKSGKSMPKWYADAFKLPPQERAKIRSKTFQGIANAMADQWGGL